MVPPRQSQRMEKGGEKGREGELGRHSSSCNFRRRGHICVPSSEKEKSPQNHTTPLPLCFTHSSRTLKKAQVLLHPLEKESRRWGWGSVLFLQKLRWADWQGQSQGAGTLPCCSLLRWQKGTKSPGGMQGASTQSVRKACRVCQPWHHWWLPCR